ncbi:acetylcholine receptor subunit gamma [Aplysia californica]|uniref:Acetylcholine receptor subunit gamma n=1 Tax=Aplysia californica TaxID=6500 RepID=A0ABM1A742_APLCA|nr:acetylcholine receptor subunit gamma [Aplysia californica]
MDLTDALRLLFALCCCAHIVTCDEENDHEPWDKDKFNKEASQTFNLVFHKYNHRVRPPQPFVEVELEVTLRHIRHLDVRKQELQTVLDVHMEWYDSRLKWDADRISQIMVNISKVWAPDIVYTNGVGPIKSLYPHNVRISSNGIVWWTRKEIVTTYCPTTPDQIRQSCAIQLGFMSNSRGIQNDRFFANTSTLVLPADFANNEWYLYSADMVLGGDNETRPSTMDVEMTLERKRSTGTAGSTQGQELTTGYVSVEGGTENCSQTQQNGDGTNGGTSLHDVIGLRLVLFIASVVAFRSRWECENALYR